MDKKPLVLSQSEFMLCTLGEQERGIYLMQIPVFSREELLEANKLAIENKWENHAEQAFLEELLEEGNNHPVVSAVLHPVSQRVTCTVLVSPEQSIELTMEQDDFNNLDVFEIPNTVH